jgi:hypothetical protein
MLLGTGQDNFFGLRTIDDLAFLLGAGFPIAIIGAMCGFFIDYILHKNSLVDTHVKCPDCSELILKDARKCKHCGRNLIQ